MEADLGQTFTTNIRAGADDDDALAGWQQQQQQQPGEMRSALDMPGEEEEDMMMGGGSSSSSLTTKDLFKKFLEQFRLRDEFCYTAMLRENLMADLHFIEVNIAHITQFSETLGQAVQHTPTRTLPLWEAAAVELALELKLFQQFNKQKEIQVQLFWGTSPVTIRQLAHETVAKLVTISGIVIKSSASYARCMKAVIQCTSCRGKAIVAGGRTIELPQQCQEGGGGGGGGRQKCRPNPYVILPMESEYEDQQVLKLQELPEDVPTGELPRHVTVTVDRYLVDKVSPGSRIHVVGIVSVQDKRGGADSSGKQQSKALRATAGLRAQYIRCAGVMQISSKGVGGAEVVSINQNFSSRVRSRTTAAWESQEEAQFKTFAKRNDVYGELAKCVDPAVYGLENQKKAIVCLLFGGTRKKQESNYLRGDMNVLLIGDPSTAKSQLLKFTEKIAPIGIYTSGKGSSAAGLTASVVGSGGGDFWLEAGSMVLADGGVVCIDEFDKMREQDQVAIHEAMEQQTISIAKASLTTMLNSRTSVLAAANPTMGSYDPLRSNEEQMDFQGSILSRFDLIFKVLDPKDPVMDRRLALHVVNMHKSGGGGGGGSAAGVNAAKPPHPLPFVTKYIAYAKATCRPTISENAMIVLLDFFVQVRKDAHALTMQAMSSSKGAGAPIIQITARQLESLVRITESLAKMRLDVLASVEDAQEAIRLFRNSTVDAINSGVVENNLTEAQSEVVQKIEEAVRRRVPIGGTVQHTRLMGELHRLGFDSKLVEKAMFIMMRRDEMEWRSKRTLVHRLR